MKLNQATDYAFRMVLHMALLPSGSKITGAVLAEHELIPERLLPLTFPTCFLTVDFPLPLRSLVKLTFGRK